MKVLTAAEMRRAEEAASARHGIPDITLMERAGWGVAVGLCARFFPDAVVPPLAGARLLDRIPAWAGAIRPSGNVLRAPPVGWSGEPAPSGGGCPRGVRRGRVLILSGPGNNGGDGLVAARYLARTGLPVTVVLTHDPARFREDARANLRRIEEIGIPCIRWEEGDPASLAGEGGIVIDALLGTGLSRPVASPYPGIIQWVNDSGLPVVAVDIPSGISADTGGSLGEAIRAELTVTMGALKRGLLLFPGRIHAGEIVVGGIGLPEIEEAGAETLTPAEAARLIPERGPETHKEECGRLLIVGGQKGMVGAPALAARGALRSGVGLITAAIPAEIAGAFHPMLPEAMTLPLAVGRKGDPLLSGKPLLDLAHRSHAAVVGPGMAAGGRPLPAFLKQLRCPVVLDAGGLKHLSDRILKAAPRDRRWILTPHEGELAKLTGQSAEEVRRNRPALVEQLVARWSVTLVLKGAGTLVGHPGAPLYINPTGNPVLATAGSGDVLAGVIGAFLAMGLPPRDAACLGVFLHGKGGDRLAASRGTRGILASEFADELPVTIQELQFG